MSTPTPEQFRLNVNRSQQVTRWRKFKKYLIEAGQIPSLDWDMWVESFLFLEAGYRGAHLHDVALVAYSRVENSL